MKFCLSFPSLGLKFASDFPAKCQCNWRTHLVFSLFCFFFRDYSPVLHMSDIWRYFSYTLCLVFCVFILFYGGMINLNPGILLWLEVKSLCDFLFLFLSSLPYPCYFYFLPSLITAKSLPSHLLPIARALLWTKLTGPPDSHTSLLLSLPISRLHPPNPAITLSEWVSWNSSNCGFKISLRPSVAPPWSQSNYVLLHWYSSSLVFVSSASISHCISHCIPSHPFPCNLFYDVFSSLHRKFFLFLQPRQTCMSFTMPSYISLYIMFPLALNSGSNSFFTSHAIFTLHTLIASFFMSKSHRHQVLITGTSIFFCFISHYK